MKDPGLVIFLREKGLAKDDGRLLTGFPVTPRQKSEVLNPETKREPNSNTLSDATPHKGRSPVLVN